MPSTRAPSDHALALAVLLQDSSRTRVRELLTECGGPEAALSRHSRIARRRMAELREQCQHYEVSLLAASETGYPERLAAIPDPPLLLYLRGNPACLAEQAVAVVGARRASLLGRETAAALARTLAAVGVVVVSGLALGIDAAAHGGAIASGETAGTTIAVLGSGLGCIAPVSNLPLARDIVRRGGLLVSEYPLLQSAQRHHFPERNRLISALADVVVVVEAGERSGSLITARLALEQGREVLAVPGAITAPNSQGVNRLLKQGAGLVDSAQDVLNALGLDRAFNRRPEETALTSKARWLLSQLRDAAVSVDELCAERGLTIAEVSVLLAELEMAGFVARSSGGYIRRPL